MNDRRLQTDFDAAALLCHIADRLHNRDAAAIDLKRSHARGHGHAGQLND
jgi:hypothetical protein